MGGGGGGAWFRHFLYSPVALFYSNAPFSRSRDRYGVKEAPARQRRTPFWCQKNTANHVEGKKMIYFSVLS